ncbi:MAG TPA: hypothetical protein VLA77_02500 [Candidatus Saccharimonadales bacterium]|nr:hypothetical protein [Candidatus Saccharimonadales bacterium]
MNTSGDLAISKKEAQNVSGQIQKNQNETTDTPQLTPLQQRKRDAMELAELIYKIYNENCPIPANKTGIEGNEND